VTATLPRPRAVELQIERLNPAGDGVARHRGRQVIVPFTLPGERVRADLRLLRDGTTLAVAVTVLEPSPHRVAPGCRHFGGDAEPGVGPCGGCSWQHIAYPEQLRLKSGLVTRLVRQAVPSAPSARVALAGTPVDQPWGYRQKVHFVFANDDSAGAARPPRGGRHGGGLVMGHYVRGTRRVVPVHECPVHDERGNAAAFALRDVYRDAGVSAAPEGVLKSVAVRVGRGSGETMGTLVVADGTDRRARSATRRALASEGATTSFHVNVHAKGDAYIFGPETRRVAGAARMRESVAGVSFLLSPTAFFQTNVAAAETLVRLVTDAIVTGPVLDLYAGAGLFALPLARAGHHVVAVESNPAGAADGEASRRLNGIPEERCRFVVRPVEQALGGPAARMAYRAVVLDPPREGCTAPVIDAVFGRIRPPVAVYVSCNPEALARDLARVVSHRYHIESIPPVDMFPHTAHSESVDVLKRRAERTDG
jgi:23S rRNA (uracil1939-C5)-methyltransferase